jgi:hypothetical protein
MVKEVWGLRVAPQYNSLSYFVRPLYEDCSCIQSVTNCDVYSLVGCSMLIGIVAFTEAIDTVTREGVSCIQGTAVLTSDEYNIHRCCWFIRPD